MNSFNLDDKKYRCCCNNFHVERGAYTIAIIGIAFSAFALLEGIVTVNNGHMVGGIIGILCSVSIIYAQQKRDPSLYLPFLIFNGLRIVLIAIYIPVLVVLFFKVPDFADPKVKSMEGSKKDQHIQNVFGVLIVLLAIFEFFAVWFQSVVYRAYKYMKMTQSNLSVHMQV